MNQIIENFLNTHIVEYGITDLNKETAFEHFVNRLIINKYSQDRFDPDDIMTDSGEIGLDGIGIIVNNFLVVDDESLQKAIEISKNLDVKFVFIQSKTSEKFEGDEIGTFCFGVKCFFSFLEKRPKTNDKIEKLIELKNDIYNRSIDFVESPKLELYYVCCGKWNKGNNLQDRIDIECDFFRDTGNFSNVHLHPIDSDKIITLYKELKKKISKQIIMERKFSFPKMDGIKQSYSGLIKCTEFVKILQDSQGNKLNNIFEDNVRDFQGYNPVNCEMQNTLEDQKLQECFAVLNNGITIIAKKIEPIGDILEVFDYQIVNGCQTSNVIYDNIGAIGDKVYVLAKIIEVENDDVLNKIIYTTNRQTEVKSEAFASTKPFHKRLEDYFNSIAPQYRLYYERRSKQYDLQDSINKNKVVTLSIQTYSYISMFLNEPHSTHRYYGELLLAYDNRLFKDDSLYEPYYISSFFTFKVSNSIKNGILSKAKYSRFKYHIICMMRAIAVGKDIYFGNSRQLKQQCNDLIAIIKDSEKLDKLLDTSISCLDEAIKLSASLSYENLHRNKEFTLNLLNVASEYSKSLNCKEYLKKGDVVSCVVSAIKEYYINVDLKSVDERNKGSIHISKIAKRYIENIAEEVKIGEILQAKILNDDYYETPYGWSLSLILN